jgi:hypothetical protein
MIIAEMSPEQADRSKAIWDELVSPARSHDMLQDICKEERMIQDISDGLNRLGPTLPPPFRPAKLLVPADPIVGGQPSRSWPSELLEALVRDREQLRAESPLRFRLKAVAEAPCTAGK